MENDLYNPIKRNMEDDLNNLENGRRPQYFRKWNMTSFFKKEYEFYLFKWKTTSIFLKMEDNLYLLKMEDFLIFLRMEEDLILFTNKKWTKKINATKFN
jgi:hypothetical protein